MTTKQKTGGSSQEQVPTEQPRPDADKPDPKLQSFVQRGADESDPRLWSILEKAGKGGDRE